MRKEDLLNFLEECQICKICQLRYINASDNDYHAVSEEQMQQVRILWNIWRGFLNCKISIDLFETTIQNDDSNLLILLISS